MNAILRWLGFGNENLAHAHSHHEEHHHAGHGHHDHGHPHGPGHGHTHGLVDPSIAATAEGIAAVKKSFVILAITALLQFVVVYLSGSVALLADTIHNLGDATTALPLWLAFLLARRKPTPTFNYGLGRVEDLAGLVIVLIIFASAAVAFYEAIHRLIHPQSVTHLGWLTVAGLIGFAGNEIVAVFRIRTGRRINSTALVADGYHARTDGLTSLAVVLGAIGVSLGFPLADPIVGLLITIAILGIVWQSASAVVKRMLDGVDPQLIDEMRHAAAHVSAIRDLEEVRARWIGHRLHVDIVARLKEDVPVSGAGRIADQLRQEFDEHLPALERVVVQFAGAGDGTT